MKATPKYFITGPVSGIGRFLAVSTFPAGLKHMTDLCQEHDPNTLPTLTREITESGASEAFRVIEPPEAELDILAVHGDWG